MRKSWRRERGGCVWGRAFGVGARRVPPPRPVEVSAPTPARYCVYVCCFGLCVFVDARIGGTPSSPLPLRLGWQYGPFPLRVGLGIFNRDCDDGERAAPSDIGIWPAGVTPIRTGHVAPPLGWAALARQAIGIDKNHSPGQAHLGREFGMHQRIDHAFGHCFVTRRSHKGRKVVVGDLGAVYPKP